MPLLIDCYNVLCSPMPPDLAGLDEDRLCRLLAASSWSRGSIVVVCDGSPKPTSPDPDSVLPIRLIYSGVNRSADEVVMERIDAHTAPRRLTVVSNDHQIRKAARRRRCRVMASERLIEALAKVAGRGSGPVSAVAPTSKPATPLLSPRDVQDWLTTFGMPVADSHDDRGQTGQVEPKQDEDEDLSPWWPPSDP